MNESGGNGTGGGSGTTSDGGNDWQKNKTCFYCKEKGHISTNCPKLEAKKQR